MDYARMLLPAATAKKPYKRQLVYLQSYVGKQWIDTGYVQTSENMEVEIEFSITNKNNQPNTGDNNYVFGVSDGTNHNSIGSVRYGSNKVFYQAGTGISPDTTWITDNTLMHVKTTRNASTTTLKVGDASTVEYSSVGTININRSIYLFCENNANGRIYTSGFSVYYCKIWTSENTLVRDMIPVLDWNDVPCVYDKVSRQLFYNQGTGQFNYA